MNIIDLRSEVLDSLDREIEAFRDQISTGACKDYASYRNACGQIVGVQTARKIIKDTIDKLVEED